MRILKQADESEDCDCGEIKTKRQESEAIEA
jgi:hypothetical protein